MPRQERFRKSRKSWKGAYLVVSDAVLRVSCAQRDGGDDRACLGVGFRADVNGARPKAVERIVFFDGMNAVRVCMAVRRGVLSVQNGRRHDAIGGRGTARRGVFRHGRRESLADAQRRQRRQQQQQ